MAINDLLSKELKVPELAPGETKIFRRMLKGRIDPQTGNPYVLSDYWQVGKQMILDPFTRKRVLLLNEVGQRPVELPDGRTRMEPIVEMIKWDETGDILITENDFEKYCFLMRSNTNASNPYRNKRIKPMFFLFDPLKEQRHEIATFDLTVDAAMYIRNADVTELKSIADKLNIKTQPEFLRTTILDRVQAGAARDIMIASKNIPAKKRIQVTDAEKYGIIIYNDITGGWYFSDDVNESICEVDINVDRVEGLIEFFGTKEGKGRYAQLANKVKKLYDAID